MTKRKKADGSLTKTGPKKEWKLTSETLSKLESAFAIDCSVVEACAFADISQDTYYRWVKDRPELSERFERLRNNPVLRAKDSVFQGLKGNPELALKYLKAKKPKEFSETVQVESKNLHIHLLETLGKIKGNVPRETNE